MFKDRYEAGRALASYIEDYINKNGINKEDVIIGFLPRGGLPIAYEIYKKLGLPIVSVFVKKLAPLDNPEYAFGAIAPDGNYLIDKNYMYSLGVNNEELMKIINSTLQKLFSYIKKYGIGDISTIKDKIIFLVDDGVATGFTAMVAGKFLKNLGARKVILAVPVCPFKLNGNLGKIFDDIICIDKIENFFAVSQGYQKFDQVEDNEYFSLLNKMEVIKKH